MRGYFVSWMIYAIWGSVMTIAVHLGFSPAKANILPEIDIRHAIRRSWALFLRRVVFQIAPQVLFHLEVSRQPRDKEEEAGGDTQVGKYPQMLYALDFQYADTGGKEIEGGAQVGEEGTFICQPGTFKCQVVAKNQVLVIFKIVNEFRHILLSLNRLVRYSCYNDLPGLFVCVEHTG